MVCSDVIKYLTFARFVAVVLHEALVRTDQLDHIPSAQPKLFFVILCLILISLSAMQYVDLHALTSDSPDSAVSVRSSSLCPEGAKIFSRIVAGEGGGETVLRSSKPMCS